MICGHEVVVSFEGMLPLSTDSETQLDLEFFRSFFGGPLDMASGSATVVISRSSASLIYGTEPDAEQQ